MDLILGQFADDEIATLSDEELDELERIMAEEDADLCVKYITGEKPVPRFTRRRSSNASLPTGPTSTPILKPQS